MLMLWLEVELWLQIGHGVVIYLLLEVLDVQKLIWVIGHAILYLLSLHPLDQILHIVTILW